MIDHVRLAQLRRTQSALALDHETNLALDYNEMLSEIDRLRFLVAHGLPDDATPPSDEICEAHPEEPWPHGDCPGPGMNGDRISALVVQREAHRTRNHALVTGMRTLADENSGPLFHLKETPR